MCKTKNKSLTLTADWSLSIPTAITQALSVFQTISVISIITDVMSSRRRTVTTNVNLAILWMIKVRANNLCEVRSSHEEGDTRKRVVSYSCDRLDTFHTNCHRPSKLWTPSHASHILHHRCNKLLMKDRTPPLLLCHIWEGQGEGKRSLRVKRNRESYHG